MEIVLEPENFLLLDGFKHRSLWKKGEPVWSALHNLKEYLAKKCLGAPLISLPDGIFLKNPEKICIGEGTVIEPGVCIQGPCIIGKNCVISHGAYLRENVILGDGCHIGHASEIKGSILLDGAKATHFVYVGDSILGRDVNLGAGVKCANLRLDRAQVTICHEGKKIPTGLKKFGAIVGDGVQIGCNTVINPGTLVGKGSFSYPLMHLKGIYPAASHIRNTLDESSCNSKFSALK